MYFSGVYPFPDLLEESWRELERECRQQRRIKEARDARRAMRPSRFAALTAGLRHACQPTPCLPVADGNRNLRRASSHPSRSIVEVRQSIRCHFASVGRTASKA
jgi:hypothetical protein